MKDIIPKNIDNRKFYAISDSEGGEVNFYLKLKSMKHLTTLLIFLPFMIMVIIQKK